MNHSQLSPASTNLTRASVGLEDRETVALRILAHSEPCNSRNRNLAHDCLSPAFLDQRRAVIDCSDFNSDADRLAGIFPSGESASDAIGAVAHSHMPIPFAAVWRVILPTEFELPSEYLPVEIDRSFWNVGGKGKVVDFRHAQYYSGEVAIWREARRP